MKDTQIAVNHKKSTPRPTILKLQNTKDKEKMLKAAREKRSLTKGMPIWLTAYCSTAIVEPKTQFNLAIDDKKQLPNQKCT